MEIKKRRVLLCGFTLVFILNLILTIRHEMWCDEAQAWLLAREMGPLTIFSKVSYEGHPFLWFYILMPFVKAGVPYAFIKAISFSIVMAAIWILMFYSPFPVPLRIILSLSPAALYFYPSISRSYSLIAVFTVLSALLHGKRQEKPVLYGLVCALLLQTHIIMAGMVFFMCLSWLIYVLRRRDGSFKKAFWGLCLPLTSALFLLWELRGAAQADAVGTGSSMGGLRNMAGTYAWALYNNLNDMMHRQNWLMAAFFLAAGGFLFFALIASADGKKRAVEAYTENDTAARKTGTETAQTVRTTIPKKLRSTVLEAAAVIIGGIAFQNIIYAFVYYANVYRLITWLYILIWGSWIVMAQLQQKLPQRECKSKGNVPAAVLCGSIMLLCAAAGMSFEYAPQAILDLKGPFTYAQETADALEQLPENAVILENREDICNSVIPRLKTKTVWSPYGWRAASYAERSRSYRHTLTVDELLNETKEHFPDAEGFYLLCAVVSDNYMEIEGIDEFLADRELVFATPGHVMSGEDYEIYYIDLINAE